MDGGFREGAPKLRAMISSGPGDSGFARSRRLFFLPEACGREVRFTGGIAIEPENNTLFGAALRTISRLLDNGISLVR
jgi:hypothetical protein